MLIAWSPQPKQSLAITQDANEILYGGARGGGKTDAGMAFLLYDKDNPLYRALVIRRNADDLRDWIDRARNFYAPVGAKITGQPAEIAFPSGAKFRTGHLKDEGAYTKYQGHEYQKILLEELTHISREDDYEKLLGSCRSTVQGIKPQVFATTNPDGPGYKWVKKRFNIPDFPKEPVFSTDSKGRKFAFIPARLEDNKHLREKDPGYELYLESIKDPDLRQAWREGSWAGISIKGAYYAELLSQAHKDGRVTNVPYEANLPVHTIWDLGIGDAMSIIFVQMVNKEVRLVDYYENNNYGLPHYMRYLKDKPYVYGEHWAPHDIKARELTTGKSRQETAESLGIKFKVVPKLEIADGINAGRQLFNRLWVDKARCEQLITSLGHYHKRWNDKLGDFEDSPLHDWSSHAADAYRYLALIADKIRNETQVISYTQPEWQELYEGVGG